MKFEFNDVCIHVFQVLNNKLIIALAVVGPDWSLPFEFMCDVSNIAIGVVLGPRKEKVFRLYIMLVGHAIKYN